MAKRKKKSPKWARVRDVLIAIGDAMELSADPQKYQRVIWSSGFEGYRELKARQRTQALRATIAYLKRRKLITERRRGDRLLLILTDEGKRRLVRASLRRAAPLPKGAMTLVTFDIPESERASRLYFRRLLKEANCRQLHKSVWISDRNICDPIRSFVRERRIEPWVHVMVGTLVAAQKSIKFS